MKFWRASLLTKLVLGFSALSTITVVLASIGAFLRAEESLFESTLERLQVEASWKELQLSEWVQDQKSDVLLLSQLQEVRLAVEILADASGLMATDGFRFNAERFSLLDGADRNAIAALNEQFSKIVAVKPNINSMDITTNGGFVLFSSNRSAPLGSYRALGPPTTFFTRKTARSVRPNFYLRNERAAITFATPIIDSLGIPMGHW